MPMLQQKQKNQHFGLINEIDYYFCDFDTYTGYKVLIHNIYLVVKSVNLFCHQFKFKLVFGIFFFFFGALIASDFVL